MARTPKGKPLTMRTLRLDDDVWAECQRLGKEYGTINEGLRTRLFDDSNPPFISPVVGSTKVKARLTSGGQVKQPPIHRSFKGQLRPSEKKK